MESTPGEDDGGNSSGGSGGPSVCVLFGVLRQEQGRHAGWDKSIEYGSYDSSKRVVTGTGVALHILQFPQPNYGL